MLRVAAIQLTVLPDTERNLTSCLSLIERAAREHGAQLVVLPEFANHSPVLDDAVHARRVAVTPDGPFLGALRAACIAHKLHLVVGVSLLTDDQLTSSALLYGPDGALLGRADRQILSSELSVCHHSGAPAALVVQTEIGQLGLCVGRDAAALDTMRALALAGAELVCAPFGPESARDLSIHLAARACENRVFLVAAGVSAAGEPSLLADCSQVLAPDGSALSLAANREECLLAVELDLSQALDKRRSDETDLYGRRRTELHRPVPRKVSRERLSEGITEPVAVGLLSRVDAGSVEQAIESAAGFVRELAQQGAQLVVLPELFCFAEGRVDDPETAAGWFQPAARRLAEACADTPTHVVTSLVERASPGFSHVGIVIGHAGIVARAGQLHVPARHGWATPARRFELLPLPWARVGILVGEDAIVPEAARALARLGAELLIAPLGAAEPRAALISLTAAALENGLSVAAATRSTEGGGSFVVNPTESLVPTCASAEEAVLHATVVRTVRAVPFDRSQRAAPAQPEGAPTPG